MDKPRLIISSAYAAILTIIFVAVITIWAELAVPLKDWLKVLSGHHWTSKSILSVLFYSTVTIVLYLVLEKPKGKSIQRAIYLLLISIALGVVALTAFYAGHHFQLF